MSLFLSKFIPWLVLNENHNGNWANLSEPQKAILFIAARKEPLLPLV
jgi:hypothetical protein